MILAVLILATQERAKEPSIDELREAAKIYADYGLPVPPKNAEIVGLDVSDRYPNSQNRFELGYRFKDPNTGDTIIMTGLTLSTDKRFSSERWKKAVVLSREQFMLIVPSTSSWSHDFEADGNLAFALQAMSFGLEDVARRSASKAGLRWSPNASLERQTYALVARHYFAEYKKKGADRTYIAKILKQILSKLEVDEENTRQMWEHRLANSIILASRPTNSRPGTHEFLIDQIVYATIGPNGPYTRMPNSVGLEAVYEAGLDIVPTLIAHMDDERASMVYQTHMGNGWNSFATVGRICTEIVGSLMPSFLDGILDRDANPTEWYQSIRGKNEKELLQSMVFYTEETLAFRKGNGNNMTDIWLRRAPLRMLHARYPLGLKDVYEQAVQKPEYNVNTITLMIGELDWPRKTKIDLFMKGLGSSVASHREDAAWQLKKLDPDNYSEVVRTILLHKSGIEKSIQGDFRASWLGQQIAGLGDESLYKDLGTILDKLDTYHRLNLIEGLAAISKNNSKKQSVLTIEKFLEDGSVGLRMSDRTESEMLSERVDRWTPGELWSFERPVSVRDFAAWSIGKLIGALVEPYDQWKDEQWAEYRAYVIDKLEKWKTDNFPLHVSHQ